MPPDAAIHAGNHPERCHPFEARPREWPILFRARLVRANREGRKNQTRRISPRWLAAKPGDVIVVRESWRADVAWDLRKPSDIGSGAAIWYEADGDGSKRPRAGKLRPSIYLPRWACRDVYPIVADVRPELLQDISEEDAIAEGLTAWKRDDGKIFYGGELPDVWETDPRRAYRRLWDSINARTASWESNPTVYVVTYQTRPAVTP